MVVWVQYALVLPAVFARRASGFPGTRLDRAAHHTHIGELDHRTSDSAVAGSTLAEQATWIDAG
jgi:hypothetical protein